MGFADTINSIKSENLPQNKNKKNKPIKPTKKSPFGHETKILSEGVPVSIKINKTVLKAFKDEKEATGANASTIATILLEKLYNQDTKRFDINIPSKEVVEYKATSFTLPNHLKKALIKGATEHNMSVYEYFNEIIENMIKE